MKPSSFQYERPRDLAGVFRVLEGFDGSVVLLAGGQSLLPSLNRRRRRADMVVDLAGVDCLSGITIDDDGALRIGAMTRQQQVLTAELVASRMPELAVAVAKTGHRGTRNWGTVGGSVVNADPTGEIPAATVALEAELVLASRAGQRVVPAEEFYTGPFQCEIAPNELLTAIRFPRTVDFTCAALEEFSRRADDFAIAGAFVCLQVVANTIVAARVVVTGGARVPLRLREVEAFLLGKRPEGPELDGAPADLALEPPDHLWASSDYRRQLVTVMTRRAITTALAKQFRPMAQM